MRTTTAHAALAAAALFAWTGAAAAQDEGEMVNVSVDGTLMPVAIDVAAEACGMDAEAIRAMAPGDATASPDAMSSDAAMSTDEAMSSDADSSTSSDSSTTSGSSMASDETSSDQALADGASSEDAMSGDASSDQSAEASAADPTAGIDEVDTGLDSTMDSPVASEGGLAMRVACEIDQATAEQHGISMSN